MRHQIRRFRIQFSRTLAALLLVASVVGSAVSIGSGPRDARPVVAGPTSPIFSPSHRSLFDSLRDFFGWRPKPVQPVAYSHRMHLAQGMACVNCHVGVDQGPDAAIPGVKVCMACHQAIATDRPEIRKIVAYAARGEDIPWQRVYGFVPSAHVRFNHAPHIRANVACASCHGDMTRQTVAERAVNLTMGYCLDCHRQRKASIDCLACHF